ncbi:aminodeoxychorismate synthase, component I [Calditerricola satsumensis]|uniref:aminodeoxychorismate synthase n=2 Tax=Calditerricola satsumensis TaxID=373054 RepID=A0A8J3BFJ1_9BACI|nr:aminodeoxychorismate synthase, component I [Calditerricola satsumensis]GGK06964.1 aminodeoxychorismate synthase, component I [Calditerricola satsumensis]
MEREDGVRLVDEPTDSLYAGRFTRVPVAWRLPWDGTDPLEWYGRLAAGAPASFLLDSGGRGRYTFFGRGEVLVVGKGDALTVTRGGVVARCRGNLLDRLREVLAARRAPTCPELPPFFGGFVGYVAYDVARAIERLPARAADDLALPEVYLMEAREVVAVDHEARAVYLIVCVNPAEPGGGAAARERLERLAARLERPAAADALHSWRPADATSEVRHSFTRDGFEAAVRRVQDYIAAGDVFQVNLSVRRSQPLDVPPFAVYRTLRRLNPSPYMGYLRFPDLEIVCGSPELLVRVTGEEVATRPIAGTRRRGRTPEEDEALARELLASEKERAEHVMLVDLQRNDLGRVAVYGTVRVDELMVIERYSHVMHLVSHVRGRRRPDADLVDCLRAVFPGGTITGAPKVRTMEIIEELEPVRRGPYTGSIGWFGYQGDMTLNIVIRTLVAKDGWAHVQAGAGIVIDSQPAAEYEECLNKARALWQAVEESRAEVRARGG